MEFPDVSSVRQNPLVKLFGDNNTDETIKANAAPLPVWAEGQRVDERELAKNSAFAQPTAYSN